MTKYNQVGRVATTVAANDNDEMIVTYHSTQVVKWNEEQITLDSGGWHTATTKVRMNQAATQYGLRFQVYQARGSWYVYFAGKTYRFSDKMRLDRKTGKVYGNTFLNNRGEEIEPVAEPTRLQSNS